MSIVAWIVLGLFVGVIAKGLMPGPDPGGLVITVLLGIAGALTGGWVGSVLGLGSFRGFDLMSLALAVLGSVLLLLAYRGLKAS